MCKVYYSFVSHLTASWPIITGTQNLQSLIIVFNCDYIDVISPGKLMFTLFLFLCSQSPHVHHDSDIELANLLCCSTGFQGPHYLGHFLHTPPPPPNSRSHTIPPISICVARLCDEQHFIVSHCNSCAVCISAWLTSSCPNIHHLITYHDRVSMCQYQGLQSATHSPFCSRKLPTLSHLISDKHLGAIIVGEYWLFAVYKGAL